MDRRFLLAASLLLTALWSGTALAEPLSGSSPLDLGYRQMYNLDFSGAHQTFQGWQKSHPDDPMGYVSDAAAYLFSEFNRLHILQTELFTDDKEFESRKKPLPDPAIKAAFDADLTRSDQLAAGILARTPNNYHAMFAEILANGLRGDYAAMIEKRNLTGLYYMKTSREIAEKLVRRDPHYYDAYLAIGVENYLLGISSPPMRWVLRLTGAETNEVRGIDNLKVTATKGHYLAPYARLLLAVAALRAKNPAAARQLLTGLAQEFPGNSLYARELKRIPKAGS